MSPLRVISTGVVWEPWSSAAFARARAERKPVLLSIGASWCHWCHEMDRTTYADPDVVAIINGQFVAIRVDADERPDISERYNLGGWPTTAFLTADGEILAGGTFVPLERMRGVLSRVSEELAARPAAAAFVREGAREAAIAPPLDAGALIDVVFDSFDRLHGGFGVEPKFPLAAPVQLALALSAQQDGDRYRAIAAATLDAMGWSALYDDIDGGFFRYAATRDWQLPHHEKLLETNAALLRLYLSAAEVLNVPRFGARAADTLRYIQNTLADPVDGGWRASQQADERYYAMRSAEERRQVAVPAVSQTLFTDVNAAMVSAALHAARVFSDDGLRAFAITSLERVLLACYKPGSGLAHYSDGQPRVRGLLVDQVATATACLDAFDTTGNVVYEMMAEELAHFALRTMWDERGGGFFDRLADASNDAIGLMQRAVKPFAINCDAAAMLRRLARTSGTHDFAAYADRTLQTLAPFAAAQGPLAAHYLLVIHSGV